MTIPTTAGRLRVKHVRQHVPTPRRQRFYLVEVLIDVGKCVMCGYCVEACPEDAIRMDTGILEFSAYSREGLVYSKEVLLALEPAGVDGLPTSVPPPALIRLGFDPGSGT